MSCNSRFQITDLLPVDWRPDSDLSYSVLVTKEASQLGFGYSVRKYFDNLYILFSVTAFIIGCRYSPYCRYFHGLLRIA